MSGNHAGHEPLSIRGNASGSPVDGFGEWKAVPRFARRKIGQPAACVAEQTPVVGQRELPVIGRRVFARRFSGGPPPAEQ